MPKILDSLVEDHARMTRILDLLEAEITVDDSLGGPDFHVIARILDYFLSFPDLCHHPKEDMVFRALEKRDPAAASRVGDLVAEHSKLASVVHKLSFTATRTALGDDRADGDWFMSMSRSLLETHRHHMKMEDLHFFPVAEQLLTDDDWRDIEDHLMTYDECFRCPETKARLDAQFQALFEQ